MPLYLCQPGEGHPEPWRHGIQVYASPFPIDAHQPEAGGGRDMVIALPGANGAGGGQPIRRVRHAEVLLVDDVCIAFDRYWLRLRWTGRKGGFAGYIAMGLVSEYPPEQKGIGVVPGNLVKLESIEERTATDDVDADDPAREETASMPPSEPYESTATVTCFRTGLTFQASPAMGLLSAYDDGISPPVAMSPFNTEPVFCRICREGLHDDADDEQPSPAAENENEGEPASRQTSFNSPEDDEDAVREPVSVHPPEELSATSKGPVTPHPSYTANPHALENPLLAPCECAGSMAFVHYLCVEQWRCRSRHPEAKNGLNCETCGAAYSLAPPSSRPANVPAMEQEDWLDAMPPHVMAALRQPHIWWQMGAAIVRRRWLRPVAPVLMSPVVALYCRARRLLKKRGVARRRWACSLCRRRARWKCVRCLRSYYCSRQCQNVSWHIVHKHVCYKPVRFWWSVVVYGAACLAVFPGILRDPLMYDLGLCLIPISFIIMGILGGSMATFLKKSLGMDLRGRLLEFAVLVWTIWLTVISWGLVKGFFGDTTACYGAIGGYSLSADTLSSSVVLDYTNKFILRPGRAYYLMWDRLALNSGAWLQSALCMGGTSSSGCFEHLPHANAEFFLAEAKGEACAGDLLLVVWLYGGALFAFAGSALWKYRERERRRLGRRVVRGGEIRLHQD